MRGNLVVLLMLGVCEAMMIAIIEYGAKLFAKRAPFIRQVDNMIRMPFPTAEAKRSARVGR